MRVAATYENGEIFQHFGKTENFKIYEVEDGGIVSAKIVPAAGSGHSAMASFLAENGVDILVCGGIGEEAMVALADAGIGVYAGAEGDADIAVVSFLEGKAQSSEANCGHGCGGCGEEEEGCGGSCGGCCGGRRIMLEGPNAGKTCFVHYRGTFNDGTQFDSSYDRGEPLSFVCGAGMMIKGFDLAVVDMQVGETKQIHLMPEEAYGPSDPRAIFDVELAELPGAEELEIGQRVYLSNTMGQQFPVTVTAKTETTITFDANHEMAGKELNFTIELVEIRE